jgi:hypothetical protein
VGRNTPPAVEHSAVAVQREHAGLEVALGMRGRPVKCFAHARLQKLEMLVDEEIDPSAFAACAGDLVVGIADGLEVQAPVGRRPASE